METYNLPPDLTSLERAIRVTLDDYAYEYPISREALAQWLRRTSMMEGLDDRPMRKAIEELRKKGYLICHRKGKGGGYYFARSKSEYEDFRVREYRSRIISLADTMRKMDQAAEERFGEEIQLELFEI